jgi:quercetin dioxygenase-like cupin family protein
MRQTEGGVDKGGIAVEEGTRREFLELATLLGTGVVLAGGATGLVIGAGAGQAGATPPTGKLTRKELAVGRLYDRIKIETSGPTDFHIQNVVLEPGADSGWHTHPGVALDIVKVGTVTAYLDDGECKPVKVEAGQAFLFPAGVTHIARNEGDKPAEVYVTYLVTAGADPRKDAEAPAGCKLKS